jgi:hypothetical protein
MSIRRLQGWALVAGGPVGLLTLLRSDSPFFRILFLVGTLLFMAGVPAIDSVQSFGILGLIGIILLELGALIALVLGLMALGGGSDVNAAMPFTSALAGGVGRVIIGWLTVERKSFAPWIGWAFLVEGLLNFLGFVMQAAFLGPILALVVPIVGAAALIGYGWGIVSYS